MPASHAWKLRKNKRSPNYYVRFSHDGVRYDESTGTADLAEAKRVARRFYGEVVTGLRKPPTRLVLATDTTVEQLASVWLAELNYETGPYLVYARHWQAHFVTMKKLCGRGAVADYWRIRLKKVEHQTARKEVGPLREFLEWCAENKLLVEPPQVPQLPKAKYNKGTAHKRGRNSAGVWIEYEQGRAIVEAMPVYLERKRGGRHIHLRAWFQFMLETGLRPKTINNLSVPEHYRPGDEYLRITDDIDKIAFGRELPLSALAREALDFAATKRGKIFSAHDLREPLRKAARKVLPAPECDQFTPYDFRRCALTRFAEVGGLKGIAHMAGHTQLTTSSIYIRTGRRDAEEILRKLEAAEAEKAAVDKETTEEAAPDEVETATQKTDENGTDEQATAPQWALGEVAWGTLEKGVHTSTPTGNKKSEQPNPHKPENPLCSGFSSGLGTVRRGSNQRTSTGVTPLAPQASVSAIPPPSRGLDRCSSFEGRSV